VSYEHFTRWTCDGCAEKAEPGEDSKLPDGWREISHFHLCAACKAPLEALFEVLLRRANGAPGLRLRDFVVSTRGLRYRPVTNPPAGERDDGPARNRELGDRCNAAWNALDEAMRRESEAEQAFEAAIRAIVESP
jgi:hypothetical protein